MKCLLVLAAIAGSINLTFGLQILAILPISMKSHLAIGNSVVKSLLDAGHNLTVISNAKPEKPIKNYRVIPIPDVFEEFKEQEPNPLELADMPVTLSIIFTPLFGADIVNAVMRSEELHEFLKTDEKFDICIMELFGDEALLGIPEKFGCSILYYTTFDAIFWTDTYAGSSSPASFVPHPYLWYAEKMNFKERMVNTVIGLLDTAVHYGFHVPYQWYLYNKYFPNAKRSFNEMCKNSSIVFINNHVSASFVRPHMPYHVEIGGIHVKPAKPLPKDLQTYLDEATDGVILFSMGSYIDGIDWKLEQREAFLKVFGSLKQKLIWRYSNDTLPENPGNIKISSWFPQRDILAHKNVKLFITHGGLLGTTEAIAEGVPVLGIPVYGDQMMNMAKTVARGYGVQVAIQDVSEETIGNALRELLSNPSYKKNAEDISRRFNDRPRTPQEEVVYWTEYVARHHGAAHLKAGSVDMSYIELFSLDVYFVLALITLVLFYIDYKIIKCLLNRFSKKKEIKKKRE